MLSAYATQTFGFWVIELEHFRGRIGVEVVAILKQANYICSVSGQCLFVQRRRSLRILHISYAHSLSLFTPQTAPCLLSPSYWSQHTVQTDYSTQSIKINNLYEKRTCFAACICVCGGEVCVCVCVCARLWVCVHACI